MRHSSRQQEWGQWMPNSQSAYCPESSGCLLRGVIATLVSIIKIPVTGGRSCRRSEIDDGIVIGVGLSGCGGHSASRFVVPRD